MIMTPLILIAVLLSHVHVSLPCIFGSDDSCHFECKCQNDVCSGLEDNCTPCDEIIGTCRGGCLVDNNMKQVYEASYWGGPGCQTGNIAYRQRILDAHHFPILLNLLISLFHF